jgi:4-amino-4-deoxy-L-arabinose transferase-like glycosyltransferase
MSDIESAYESGRLDRTLLLVLLLGALASLPFTVRDFWDARPDAARYLLAARSLADGHGYAVMGEPFRLRPPGFSALLAPLVAWRGFDFAFLNLTTSLTGVAAVALLYLLVLPRTGAVIAFGVAVVAWLNPQLQALCNQVMSDVPALALALLALLLARRTRDRASPVGEAALVLTLVAGAYVRSANVLLVPAILLDRVCARWPGSRDAAAADGSLRDDARGFALRRLVLPAAAFALLYLPWVLTPSYTSQYDSPDLHSYTTAFLRADPNDPDAPALGAEGWSGRIAGNASAYASLLATGMASRRPLVVAPPVALLALAALLVVLARRREAPEWFALGTCAVIALYYVAQARLLLPVFVLAVAALAETLQWIVARVASRRAATTGVTALLLVTALAQLAGDPRPNARAEHASLVAATDLVRETTPAGVAVAGDMGAVYALLLDRPVYSLRPLGRRGQDAELARLLDERGVGVIVAERPGPLDALVERLRADGADVVPLAHHVVVRVGR